MNKHLKRFSLALSAVLITGQVFLSSACEKKTINLSTAFPTGHILSDFSLKFKAIVEKRSLGLIKVNVDAGTQTEEAINLECANGTVDMQANGGYPLQVFAPQYFFFNGPYVIKDYDHFLRVWNGKLGCEAKAKIYNDGNMISLGTVYRGFRQMTSNTPVNGPDDIAGLKLRLPSVPVWTTIWQSLGANPVTVPLTGLYQSLADGTAEASEGDLAQILSYKLYEVQSYLSITNHLLAIGWIEFNKHSFEKFNILEKLIIIEAVKEACDYATAKTKANESTQLTELQNYGMIVVTPDADAIRNQAKPTVEALFRTEWPVTTWDEILAQ